jgi:ubiquinone/menaquinone biosynthesis C-methylase UbiE
METYAIMQSKQYEADASNWSLSNLDPVVGSFLAHNSWNDYEYLFTDIPDIKTKKIIDFGCGPGRNIVKYRKAGLDVDGVDIAQNNLNNARIWMSNNGVNPNDVNLYKCNGTDLNGIGDDTYDVVTSTITMQHICMHSIRLNYFKEFYRILRPGGYITIQMGYGPQVKTKTSVDYYDNYFSANATNGACDTRVEGPDQLSRDLTRVGFKNFKYYIRPVGPGDGHPNWIFFSGQK